MPRDQRRPPRHLHEHQVDQPQRHRPIIRAASPAKPLLKPYGRLSGTHRALERLSYQKIADRLNLDLDRYPPPEPATRRRDAYRPNARRPRTVATPDTAFTKSQSLGWHPTRPRLVPEESAAAIPVGEAARAIGGDGHEQCVAGSGCTAGMSHRPGSLPAMADGEKVRRVGRCGDVGADRCPAGEDDQDAETAQADGSLASWLGWRG
jgi:hypothetical protein